MNNTPRIYAAIETGGTKFVCSLGYGDTILDSVTIPTCSPDKTFSEVVDYLHVKQKEIAAFAAIGIASFGPLGTNRDRADFGKIQSTPKPGWSNVDVIDPFREFAVPVVIDTDVNIAALGEARLGRGRGKRVVAYATIGTGIGVGICVEGKILAGFAHPEIGHISVRVDEGDNYQGGCPFHSRCLEGLAAGPAIKARWGKSLSELPAGHEALRLEAGYIAQLCTSLLLSYSPDSILLGGGVMQTDGLLELVKDQVFAELNGYLAHIDNRQRLDGWIANPEFFGKSAVVGAFIAAEEAEKSF